MKDQSVKVYYVTTGIFTQKEGDNQNVSGYTVLGADAESAIKTAKEMFHFKGEYVESVKLVTILD